MTKTQVNSVPLIIQLRMPGLRLPDKIRDALYLLFAFGSQPFKSRQIVEETRFCLFRHEIHKLGQN
jgi:hypothetical protein